MINYCENLIIERAKTCAVSGHRIIDKNIDIDLLKETFKSLILDGYNTYLIGMAIGFDTLCFQILYGLKKEYDIKIIACIPCENQDSLFSYNQKIIYEDLINKADERVLLSKNYNKDVMKKRNMFLVKNSSCLVSYLRRNYGGTFQTVNFAKKENIKIISL